MLLSLFEKKKSLKRKQNSIKSSVTSTSSTRYTHIKRYIIYITSKTKKTRKRYHIYNELKKQKKGKNKSVVNLFIMCADRSSRRREMDLIKLMNGPRKVYPSNTVSEFWVEFCGPEGTPYEDGMWYIHVLLPVEYPFKSPSIGFSNRIYHPNVEEASGSVCLDVINQSWTPMYELQNIFDVFLPQLLRYPNAGDPLNSNAASKLLRDPIAYVSVIRNHVAKYATRELALQGIPEPFRPQPEDVAASEEKSRFVAVDDSPDALKGLTETLTSCYGSEEDEYEPEAIDI